MEDKEVSAPLDISLEGRKHTIAYRREQESYNVMIGVAFRDAIIC